jgi:hypothetical protein
MRLCSCCFVPTVPLLECHGILRHQCKTGRMESGDLDNTVSIERSAHSIFYNLPPSSLAMTSALSSTVVYAIELLEFPKDIPITFLSVGVTPFVVASSPAILNEIQVIQAQIYRFHRCNCFQATSYYSSLVRGRLGTFWFRYREIYLAPLVSDRDPKRSRRQG